MRVGRSAETCAARQYRPFEKRNPYPWTKHATKSQRIRKHTYMILCTRQVEPAYLFLQPISPVWVHQLFTP